MPLKFQSTPDYLNRENAGILKPAAEPSQVSIHSRLFKPGEYQRRDRAMQIDRVSIHSRLFKPGECQRHFAVSCVITVSIHSRLFKPGEYKQIINDQPSDLFQSTPDYLNREN